MLAEGVLEDIGVLGAMFNGNQRGHCLFSDDNGHALLRSLIAPKYREQKLEGTQLGRSGLFIRWLV